MYPRFIPEIDWGDLREALFRRSDRVELAKEFLAELLDADSDRAVYFFSSGRGALYAALQALPQSRVFIQAYIGYSVFQAAELAGKEVHPVDIDPDTLGLDLRDLKKRIVENSIIVVAHLFGIPSDIDEIMTLAREKSCIVIEDACAATGATIRGVRVGNFGDLSIFSFDHSKTLTTLKGGALVINNSRCINSKVLDSASEKRMRSILFSFQTLSMGCFFLVINRSPFYRILLRYLRYRHKRDFFDNGSYHLAVDNNYLASVSNFKVSLLRHQISKLGSRVARRRELHERYVELLRPIAGVTFPARVERSDCALITFPILVKPEIRLSLSRHARQMGVDLGWTFSYVNHDHPSFSNSRMVASRILNLPIHSSMTLESVDEVVNSVISFAPVLDSSE